MARLFLIPFLVSSLLFSCAEKKGFDDDPDMYKLAKALALKVPALDPEKDNVLVRTRDRVLTCSDIIAEMKKLLGAKVERLRFLNPRVLRERFEQQGRAFALRFTILDRARTMGLKVTQSEIDSVLSARKNKSGSEEDFDKRMKFYQIEPDNMRDDVRETLLLNKYLRVKLADKIAVSEAEMERIYQQGKSVRVLQILLNTVNKNDAEKAELYKRMEGILARARSGENFEELARRYSQDGSKKHGGLYPPFERGEMVKPFQEAAFACPVGKITDIVETQFGYHIIKVLDRKPFTVPFEEARREIKQQAQEEKMRESKPLFLEQLSKEIDLQLSISS